MSVSAHLGLIQVLLFVALWVFTCAFGAAVSAGLVSASVEALRGAIARVVPLAVAAVSACVLFAGPALSVLTQPAAAPSDVVRGLFVAVWLAQAILAAHVIHSAVRVLTAYQRSAR